MMVYEQITFFIKIENIQKKLIEKSIFGLKKRESEPERTGTGANWNRSEPEPTETEPNRTEPWDSCF